MSVALRSATIVNMGAVALRLNHCASLLIPVKLEFINDEVANRLLDQPMKAPWNVKHIHMKKVYISIASLLLCGSMLMAQSPANRTSEDDRCRCTGTNAGGQQS